MSADAAVVTSSVDAPAINETKTLEEDWFEPLPNTFAEAEFELLVDTEEPPPKRDDWQVERAAPAAQLPLTCFTLNTALSTCVTYRKY